MSEDVKKRAGFFRRLAAMVYDGLIAVAIGMLSALVIIGVLTALFAQGIIPNQGFEHFNEFIQQSVIYTLIVQIWVLIWVSVFFLWFWKHGGQTLGMRAWRIRIFNLRENDEVGYKRLFIRLISSLCGLGTLLVLIDFKNKLALQDRLTQTEVLVLSKEENHHRAW
uniref:RDD family protein n=1 Tax=Ningiella ruwaisensis TaxID=2364274 RepID=UPI00109F6B68|nr:RDD family protein [Ningiella ruwaisensis]